MDQFTTNYLEARRRVIAADFPHLNERQLEAVLATEGPLLILAGAGSGKTTVLINRIANLMKYGRASDSTELPPDADGERLRAMEAYLAGDAAYRQEAELAAALDPVEPWRILTITFTNKAAGELKDRLSAMLGAAAEDIWARTFHSACVRILRRDAERLGYPSGFVIYDTDDRTAVMKRIVREQNRDEKMYPPRWVLGVIDKAKDRLQSPEDFAAAADRSGDFRMQGVAALYAAYAERLREAGAMDFEDLIYNTVRLLQEFPDVREYYRRKFRYVLIDEYQDTNHLQYLLASLLTDTNICVVGDDDQSIYAFRGATIENILSFESRYRDSRVIRLEQNYRSTGHILDAANAVVSNNTGRKGKRLWTRAGAGERITLYVAKNEDDEAQYIVRQVLRAVERGDNLRDHAVLYRLNAQSRSLEQAFLRNGIRPRIVKGNPFFERAEIKDLMAYFFVLLNPADELRLLRIINVPARGIGAATVEKARLIAGTNGIPLFTVISLADRFPELSRAAGKLQAFAAMMNELSFMSREAGLASLYDALLEKTGYARILEETKSEENLNRLENVRERKSFIVTHVKQTGDDSLAGFLDEVSLYTDLQNMRADENTVTLMTIHSAKGLEFPTVFIAGMEEGIFPSLQAIGESEQMEEERRLAYVAITRAKRRLYITSARQRMVFGQTASHRISRFVDEIPPEHIDRPYSELRPSGFALEDFPAVGKTQWRAPKKTVSPPRPAGGGEKQDFREGDRVEHNVFGAGVIAKLTPMGGDALVEIDFVNAGKKRLMLKAASRYLRKL
ncbi:MAG: UvrD-helicase domain-containing protein [Oscillospiraceae bacterium]|nr:UvrD-helicase domain-containing protein [Oscillospiraceae bacterium]